MRQSLIQFAAAVRSGTSRSRVVTTPRPSSTRPTVYLTHVKWVTGKQQLEKYFSKYGSVKNVTMFFDPLTGLHRGFASVTFEHADSATAAMQQRPHVIDGDRVNVEPFIPLKNATKDLLQ